MNFRVVLGLVLLAAAVVSGWSLWRNRVVEEAERAESGRSEYVLRDFELTALDKAGRESFTLRAPLLHETPGANTMELTTPLFLLPDEQGNYWNVRSKSGWVSENRKEIRLRGDVHAQSPEGDPQPVDMKTQQLNVFPDTNRATSPTVVTITQPGSILRGRGLEADLAEKRYKLLSQVHSRYVRTNR
jgi:lipopolysaccharide export system protein LptC